MKLYAPAIVLLILAMVVAVFGSSTPVSVGWVALLLASLGVSTREEHARDRVRQQRWDRFRRG